MQNPRSMAAFFGLYTSQLPLYDFLYRNRCITLSPEPEATDERRVRFDVAGGGPYQGLLDEAARRGPVCMADLFLTVQAIGGGPKLYRPKPDEMEALTQVRAEVPIEDYQQPFDTF